MGSINKTVLSRFIKIKFLIQNFFEIPQEEKNNQESIPSARIYQFFAISLTSLFGFFSIQYLTQGLYKIAFLQGLVAFVILISWVIYKKTHSVVYAANFILIFGAPSAAVRAYMMGGIESPAFFVWPLVPIATMALLPFRWAMFWTSVYISIAIFYFTASKLGYQFENRVDASTVDTVRIVAIVMVQLMCLCIMYYIKKVNRQYLTTIQNKTDEKTNLVRVLTHDLSSPIMVLQYTSVALKKKYGTSVELERAERAIRAIQSIIQEVRELEAVDSGKKELTLKPVNIKKSIEELLVSHSESFKEKNIELICQLPSLQNSFYVVADEHGLCYQVLNNLLTNAYKFTEKGGKVIIQLQDIGHMIELKIQDTGIGIPQSIIENIFSTNKKTTRKGTLGESGTGFGMPIVKTFIEKFGGTITVSSIEKTESVSNHGTTITVALPKAFQRIAA